MRILLAITAVSCLSLVARAADDCASGTLVSPREIEMKHDFYYPPSFGSRFHNDDAEDIFEIYKKNADGTQSQLLRETITSNSDMWKASFYEAAYKAILTGKLLRVKKEFGKNSFAHVTDCADPAFSEPNAEMCKKCANPTKPIPAKAAGH